ncbi:MAG: cytochrome c [Planctomycetota bacterium]
MKRLAPVALLALAFVGCDADAEPGLLPGLMRDQPRVDAYERGPDGHPAGRVPPPGAVPRAPRPPQPSALELLELGRRVFGFACSPCHGYDGRGQGAVVVHGFPAPPSLHTPRLRAASDAALLEVVLHGRGKMPSYRALLRDPEPRAVVAYVRALQLSQRAPLSALTPVERARLERAR